MTQEFYKKIYTHKEFYRALRKGLRSLRTFSKVKKTEVLDPKFIERIMLAVTEVNGCEVCSYGHTQEALKAGIDGAEIELMLKGDTTVIPQEELVGVLFAQHFADQRGIYDEDMWQELVKFYGKEKAEGILAACRLMTMGNIYGIAFSAFRNRLKGKPVKKTGFFYETSMLLSIVLYLPSALIQNLFTKK